MYGSPCRINNEPSRAERVKSSSSPVAAGDGAAAAAECQSNPSSGEQVVGEEFCLFLARQLPPVPGLLYDPCETGLGAATSRRRPIHVIGGSRAPSSLATTCRADCSKRAVEALSLSRCTASSVDGQPNSNDPLSS